MHQQHYTWSFAYWGRAVGSRTARAIDVAARLAAATGLEARIDEQPSRIRITTQIPDDLTEPARQTVLAALAALPPTDTYGHDRTEDDLQTLWVELRDWRSPPDDHSSAGGDAG
jgi:hypothetical protein